jgi:hypothetical protein
MGQLGVAAQIRQSGCHNCPWAAVHYSTPAAAVAAVTSSAWETAEVDQHDCFSYQWQIKANRAGSGWNLLYWK